MRTPMAVGAAGLASVTLLHVRDPHAYGSYGLCPFRALTGLWCPGCGGLREVNDLTHLEFGAAVSSNVVVVALVLVVGVAFLVVKAGSFGALRSELRFIERTHDEVAALVAQPLVRDRLRCGPLTFPTYRLVPDARWQLDADADGVRTRAGTGGTLRSPGGVAVYIVGDEKFERRFGRADGVSRATNRPPRGEPALRTGPFAGYAVCQARPR